MIPSDVDTWKDIAGAIDHCLPNISKFMLEAIEDPSCTTFIFVTKKGCWSLHVPHLNQMHLEEKLS